MSDGFRVIVWRTSHPAASRPTFTGAPTKSHKGPQAECGSRAVRGLHLSRFFRQTVFSVLLVVFFSVAFQFDFKFGDYFRQNSKRWFLFPRVMWWISHVGLVETCVPKYDSFMVVK